MSPGLRYALLQIPGIVVAALLLGLAIRLGWLSAEIAWVVFGLWILKDAAFYLPVRSALTRAPQLGPERMVGQTAVVERALDPAGTVRVAGELWRAESREGSIGVGTSTRVEAVRGLVLEVRRVVEGSGA